MKRLTLLLLSFLAGSALAATEEQLNKTFQVASGGALVVDVDFGAIEVNTNSADSVSVNVWRRVARGSAAKEQKFLTDNPVTFVQEGGTLTVRSRVKEGGWSRWFGGSGRRNEARYTILVPARFDARLTTAGDGITVSNLTGAVKAVTSGGALRFARLHGPLDGDTSGGGIRVTECEGTVKIQTSGGGIDVLGGSGSLNGDTSGGAITVKKFKGPVAVGTSGGGITLEEIAGAVKGDTSGGSIHAVLLSPLPGEVSLATSGGGVTVKVPADAAFNLDASTSGGGVSSDFLLTTKSALEPDRIKGTVNGGGPALQLESSGGSIHVQKI